MRKAVAERGMSELVAPNGKEAARRLTEEKETLSSFDPLMGMFWAITNRLISEVGVSVLQDGCPMCHADQGHKEECKRPDCTWTINEWIPSCADSMLNHAIELGWERKLN